MPRQVILLRGINLGATNRVSMPELREVLAAEGFTDVATYLQSGNIVVSHRPGSEVRSLPGVASGPPSTAPGRVGSDLAALIKRLLSERFELSVPVLVLTAQQLATAVSENPFTDLAERDPKHFLVTFLSGEPDPVAVEALKAFAAELDDELDATANALYSWHPGGIHLSKLAPRLTEKRLQVEVATSRNWTTVLTLLEMAAA